MKFLDCTLRDGGYYTAWDFNTDLINEYLAAMQIAGIDIVELGLRSLKNSGFKGANAYTTDDYLRSLVLPKSLMIGVMVNACELVGEFPQMEVLKRLFPVPCSQSPVDLVRIACHVHEVAEALPAVTWLKAKGYSVGFNLMQVADKSEMEIKALAKLASNYPLDVVYFADSMGSMQPKQVVQIVQWLRSEWQGNIGIHTHDNLGLALSNTLEAIDEGVTWVDATVTGMGRGPGNARTEELAIEIAADRTKAMSLIPLMKLVREHFKPMQTQYGWGTNPYYYLAGKYGIHPSYIQEMLSDSRYDEEDIMAVISYLREQGGKKFSLNTLDSARHFYLGDPQGKWGPCEMMQGREVLLIGSGSGTVIYRNALERYIRQHQPLVIALNTHADIAAELINVRVACHPVRLLADCEAHIALPQPLIVPASMLPTGIKQSLDGKQLLDFGLSVKAKSFSFDSSYAILPNSLVVAYALAVITSGKAVSILMAGFDGYGGDDPRTLEMQDLLDCYTNTEGALPLMAVTPTSYSIHSKSIYAL